MKIKLVTLTLLLSLILGTFSVSAETQLTDVKGHWAEDTIVNMVDNGYISGYPNHTFKPDHDISRAEFVSLVGRVLELDGANNPFSDDTDAKWANGIIGGATQSGIIDQNEYSSTFEPNKAITRREMIKMMALGLAYTNEEFETSLDTFKSLSKQDLPFTDEDTFQKEDLPYLAMGIGTELVGGYGDYTLRVGQTATRAEAAVMLNRFINTIAQSPSDYPYINELIDVATIGTNANVVSDLDLKQESYKGLVSENGNIKAEIKRMYVLPFTQESLYTNKFMVDKETVINRAYNYWDTDMTDGWLAFEVDVTFKKDMNIIGLMNQTQGLSGYWIFDQKSKEFGFSVPMEDNGGGKKGETKTYIYYGQYNDGGFDIDNSSTRLVFYANNYDEYNSNSYTLYKQEYEGPIE